MMKRLLALFVLVCVICAVACSCEEKETISIEDAISIALTDLGVSAEEVEAPHVHIGQYNGQSCYNVYVTVEDHSYVYSISTYGEILHSELGSHSH